MPFRGGGGGQERGFGVGCALVRGARMPCAGGGAQRRGLATFPGSNGRFCAEVSQGRTQGSSARRANAGRRRRGQRSAGNVASAVAPERVKVPPGAGGAALAAIRPRVRVRGGVEVLALGGELLHRASSAPPCGPRRC